MLSNDSPSTPRPRPPAKTRRTVSGRYKDPDAPPPPYAPTIVFPSDLSDADLDTILGSPISMTAQRVRLLSATSPDLGAMPSPEVEEWVNERSREELEELLLKAGKAIRERENELGLTSAVCKSLYQENTSLKTQHDALLSRLPSSQPISPIAPPFPSLPSPSPFSPSLPLSAQSTLSSASRRNKHNRRISVTPSEITRLADQNAELMLSLEKLESEAKEADQAGKRKLRKLEKEIQLLKEELESTQEVESRMKRQEEGQAKEARRREREEMVRAVRKGAGDDAGEEGEGVVRDFAPGGALSAGSTPSRRRMQRDFTFPPRARSSSPTKPQDLDPASSDKPEHTEEQGHDAEIRSPEENPNTELDPEFASNAAHSYFPADTHLAQPSPQAQHESALISQLLLKIRELEETNQNIVEQQAAATGRMREAKKEAEGMRALYEALEGVGEVVLEEGEEHSEPDAADADTDNDGGEEDGEEDSGKTIRFRSFRKSIVGGMPPRLELGEDQYGAGRQRTSVVGLFGAESPSIGFPAGEAVDISEDAEPAHTLGSELGDEWDGPASVGFNHHLRTTSLFGLSELTLDAPGDGVPSRSSSVVSVAGSDQTQADGGAATPRSTTPIPMVEPKTKRDSLRLRNKLLSQTVKARTGQWLDGRFKGTLRSPAPGQGEFSVPTETGALSRTASVARFLEGAVGSVFRPPSTPTSPTAQEGGEGKEGEEEKAVLKSDAEKRGLVAVVLDLWLWLQFVIIILVFLWAMAKRGPRNVMEEAERRRAVARR
ncbi:hypothetical protein OE88DRAFT_1651644 [Heliocybe sulcata]|uniref:Uncharacterized protein n=1 Tax=Heliocybe sulcata TaxID=5364 RepID=A0A5C3NDH8_9AGAM|nr:hypothetical protein OE88DRAFT_1651644 [Heliocybe sulcata]